MSCFVRLLNNLTWRKKKRKYFMEKIWQIFVLTAIQVPAGKLWVLMANEQVSHYTATLLLYWSAPRCECTNTVLWISYSIITVEDYLNQCRRQNLNMFIKVLGSCETFNQSQEVEGCCSFSLRWQDKDCHKTSIIRGASSHQINKSFDW